MNKETNLNYFVEPLINGLSDHDAQLITLRNNKIHLQKPQPKAIGQINETTLAQFKLYLSEENWSNTFEEEDIEKSFNNFLNVYLKIFNRRFPFKKYYNKHANQGWVTKGIKTSCNHKRDLYILCKNTNNSKIKLIIKCTVKYYQKLLRWPKDSISITLLNILKINLNQCGVQ